MKRVDWKLTVQLLLVLALAGAAPNAFPIAQLGHASLHDLGRFLILPSAILLVALGWFSKRRGNGRIAQVIFQGTAAGALATLALEAIRYPGFRLGYMPGNLPELMGVLLLDRFAEGPSAASSLAGFGYHFCNGASFGVIYAALGLGRRSPLWALIYGVAIGVGFLASPVVQSLGGGPFGREFGWRFVATVLSAHAAFGLSLGLVLRWKLSCACQAGLPPRELMERV